MALAILLLLPVEKQGSKLTLLKNLLWDVAISGFLTEHLIRESKLEI